MQCPACAGTQFSSESDDALIVTCTNCEREITRDELRAANQENIDAHLEEVKREVQVEAERHLKKSLTDAFRGNKFIKIK